MKSVRENAPEAKGLLDNIRSNPDDDAPRLIYADWLEEHDTGDGKQAARANFIRIQCILDDSRSDTALRLQLKEQEQELLEEFREEWEQELMNQIPKIEKINFRRGFAERIAIDTTAFLHHARHLFALAPIREVNITDCDEQTVRALAASPFLANLHSLNLDGSTISDVGARALAGSPNLTGLTSLNLHFNDIGDDGARALAASPYLANLHSLDLSVNEIGDSGARALATSAHLRDVRSLDLSYNEIGDAGARSLLRSLRSGSLRNVINMNVDSNDLIRSPRNWEIDQFLEKRREGKASGKER